MPAAIVLGLDFGTTQSCASAIRPDGRTNPGPDAVHTVTNYPDDPTTLHITGMSSEQVPTEIFYPDPAVADSYMDVDDKTASATFDFEQGRVIAARQRFSEQSDETAQRRRVDSVGLDEEPVTRSLPKCARWGFECQHSPVSSVSTSPRNDILRIFKLMLDQSEATVDIRRDLCVKLNALKRTLLQSDGSEMIIERHEDPISDFLSCQLQHTKHQLQHDLQLQDDESMELVFTVPAIWTPKACRVMERAILGAMTSANLGASSLISLFIVSEPEAAAAYMLANLPVIMRNTTFVLLDAGGGTIDATTYMVSGTDPLRLEREAVAPGGKLCGSTYLNQAFYRLLTTRLQPEDFQHPEDFQAGEGEEPRTTIHDIVMSDGVMGRFESLVKRRMDFDDMRQAWVAFSIPGLEANLRKRFKNGQILVGKREYEVIFEEPLAGTSAVMEGQIKSCAAASISVDYVVLTGGFGGCPALKKRLEQNLQQLSTDNSHETRLITTNAKDSAVAVSRGAILRALNKEDGPARFLLMSFGILRHEPYDKSFEGHVWARQNNVDSKSKLDGISYVDHCIEWLIVNDDTKPVTTHFKAEQIESVHKIPADWKEIICEEEVYVMDDGIPENHYTLDHPKNKGCEKLGKIEVDMTDLRKELKLTKPKRKNAQPYYEIKLGVSLEINGRNLMASAEYPFKSGRIIPASVNYFSIAAAFQPGTE